MAIWPRRTPLRLDSSGKFLSVGQPCRGVRVRIMDGDEEVKPGVEAGICVSSPGVMQGYYNNPEATRKVLSPDGWLRTGDLGFLDAEGFLYVTGRLKDVIILGGENVIPADIEEVVDHVPGVRYSAAVGIDSERTGTQRLHVVAEVRERGGRRPTTHSRSGARDRPACPEGTRPPARPRAPGAAQHHPQDVERARSSARGSAR